MNFSERCQQAGRLLAQLKLTVEALDKDACELDKTQEDEVLLLRMVQMFRVCNRLSEEILYEEIPHIEQESFVVGSVMRMTHDGLMERARGAHTDLEVHTKRRAAPRPTAPLYAVA